MWPTTHHLVIDMDLGKSFFNKWHPPTTIWSWLSKCWFIIVNWEEIINCNIFWTSFYKYFKSKYPFMSVLLSVEQLRNSISSLGQSSQHSKEIIVTKSSLLEPTSGNLMFCIPVFSKEWYLWNFIFLIWNAMKIFGSPEILEPI